MVGPSHHVKMRFKIPTRRCLLSVGTIGRVTAGTCGFGKCRSRQSAAISAWGRAKRPGLPAEAPRSEEHTSDLQSLMRISYAVFCLKTKNQNHTNISKITN